MREIDFIKRPKSKDYNKIEILGIDHAIVPVIVIDIACMDGRRKLIDPNIKRPRFNGGITSVQAQWAAGSAGDVLGLLATDKKLSPEDAVSIVKKHAKKVGKVFTYHEGCAHVNTALNGKHNIPINKIEKVLSHVDQSVKKKDMKAKIVQYDGKHGEIALENVHGTANTVIPVNPDIQVFRQDITIRNEHLTEVAETAQSMGFLVRPKKLISKVDELVGKTLESVVPEKTPIYNIYLDREVPIVEPNGFISPRR
jgi:hypothetical protein